MWRDDIGHLPNSSVTQIQDGASVAVKPCSNETPIETPALRKQATNLLNQQIWCWGRDIECSGGNWLVRHGFERIEKPAGSNAASLYRLDLSPTSRIILRGFGVFVGDERWGGLFLRRFDFAPQLTPAPDLSQPVWMAGDLPPLVSPGADQVPNCQRLLLTLIDWIRSYEVWIAEQAGVAYRSEMLVDWSKKHGTVVPAEEIAFAWRLLGVAVSDNPAQFIPNINKSESPTCVT